MSNPSYPPQNRLIGNFLGAGACGFAFEVVGEPNMVIKVGRLVNYESINPMTISDFDDTKHGAYSMDWVGGIALNEFQAILFSQLYDMQKSGEETSPHLPKVYAFSSGEMQQSMLDEITRSYEFYEWPLWRYGIIKDNFHPRKGDKPGTRVGLWIIEKVERAGTYDKKGDDSKNAQKQVVGLNKWLRKHNYIVRDTVNSGNWGFRTGTDEIVWFDPGVSPWPIKEEWKGDEDVQLRNLYYLFSSGFGMGEIPNYRRKLEKPQVYDEGWHQAESKE